MVWGALQFPAWLSDRLQEGVGKPYLEAAMLILEQSLRIAIMFALSAAFSFWVSWQHTSLRCR